MEISVAELLEMSAENARLRLERDNALKERDKARREEEEVRGIVETYGRVQLHREIMSGEVTLSMKIDEWLVMQAAGGSMMVFMESLKKCARQWEEWFDKKSRSS